MVQSCAHLISYISKNPIDSPTGEFTSAGRIVDGPNVYLEPRVLETPSYFGGESTVLGMNRGGADLFAAAIRVIPQTLFSK